MNVLIYTDDALNFKHGTGAQVIRTFVGQDIPFVHFYRLKTFVPSEYEPSIFTSDKTDFFWKPSRGKRVLERIAYNAGLRWRMSGRGINTPKFMSEFRRLNFKPDVAYIIVLDEDSAADTAEVVREIGCPYVVHIMDIFHPEGLEPAKMPGFKALLKDAHSVFCITPAVQDEVSKFGVKNSELILIGQEMSSFQATAPKPGEPLKIIMVGNPYRAGMELLADTMPLIDAMNRKVEFSYLGAVFAKLPERLQSRVNNIGLVVERENYQRIISEHHLAFLCGPAEMDFLARFSFPSRTSDYLSAGLPVLANVVPGSAAEKILSELTPDAVRFTRTPAALSAAIDHFAGSLEAWTEGSRKSREFAFREMNISHIRQRILDSLKDAADSRQAA